MSPPSPGVRKTRNMKAAGRNVYPRMKACRVVLKRLANEQLCGLRPIRVPVAALDEKRFRKEAASTQSRVTRNRSLNEVARTSANLPDGWTKMVVKSTENSGSSGFVLPDGTRHWRTHGTVVPVTGHDGSSSSSQPALRQTADEVRRRGTRRMCGLNASSDGRNERRHKDPSDDESCEVIPARRKRPAERHGDGGNNVDDADFKYSVAGVRRPFQRKNPPRPSEPAATLYKYVRTRISKNLRSGKVERMQEAPRRVLRPNRTPNYARWEEDGPRVGEVVMSTSKVEPDNDDVVTIPPRQRRVLGERKKPKRDSVALAENSRGKETERKPKAAPTRVPVEQKKPQTEDVAGHRKRKPCAERAIPNTGNEVLRSSEGLPEGWLKIVRLNPVFGYNVAFYTPQGYSIRSMPQLVNYVTKMGLKRSVMEGFDFSTAGFHHRTMKDQKSSFATPGLKLKNSAGPEVPIAERTGVNKAKTPRKRRQEIAKPKDGSGVESERLTRAVETEAGEKKASENLVLKTNRSNGDSASSAPSTREQEPKKPSLDFGIGPNSAEKAEADVVSSPPVSEDHLRILRLYSDDIWRFLVAACFLDVCVSETAVSSFFRTFPTAVDLDDSGWLDAADYLAENEDFAEFKLGDDFAKRLTSLTFDFLFIEKPWGGLSSLGKLSGANEFVRKCYRAIFGESSA